MAITVDRFLAGVKRRITMPANQQLLEDTDILEMADDVIKERVVPLIMSTNQNYFVIMDNVATVADQAEYDIPYRAMGRALRDLKLAKNSDANNVMDLALVALEDAHMFATSGIPSSFHFMGDQVVMVPKPLDDSHSLQFFYNLQPSRLVSLSVSALVQAVSGDVVTCASTGGLEVGESIDFIKGRSGSRVLSREKTITVVSGPQFTFNVGDVPLGLAPGDYISAQETTPVIQLPDEAVPYLEALTSERVLQAIGDLEGAGALNSKIEALERNLAKVLSPRIKGESTKIVNRNGLLRGKGFSSSKIRGGFYY